MHFLKLCVRCFFIVFARKPKKVYLDYNATTPPHSRVLKSIQKIHHHWGNPSSVYQKATDSKNLLWKARQNIAQFIHADPLEIVFTSGASESNNFALKGAFEKAKEERRELIVSDVEHPSVMKVAEFLSQKGCVLHRVPVSRDGALDMDFFEEHLSEKTFLVSIMAANNETGVLFSLPSLIEKVHSQGALFHSDMVQILGKLPVDVQKLNLDLASFSGHKCYGLKGSGILYCKKQVALENLIHGGPQERSRRAGTENLWGALAFGIIAEERASFLEENKYLEAWRTSMEKEILQSISDTEVIGYKQKRLPNTSCILIPGLEGESLLMNLDLKGFSVSVGSACNSGKLNSSSVLTAMGLTEKEARSCIRISLGCGLQKKDFDRFVDALKTTVKRLRALS